MNYFKLITIVALLLCLAPMPYGYYMIVRIVTMVAFGMMGCDYAKSRRKEMAWACLAVVILFQPFFKIPLGRDLWNCVDVAAALFITYNLRDKRNNKELNEKRQG